jgi:hypothetical protein
MIILQRIRFGFIIVFLLAIVVDLDYNRCRSLAKVGFFATVPLFLLKLNISYINDSKC